MNSKKYENIYVKYLNDGVTCLNIEDLYFLNKYLTNNNHLTEAIEVSEYAVSLLEMGINDNISEDFLTSEGLEHEIDDEDDSENYKEDLSEFLIEHFLQNIIEHSVISNNSEKLNLAIESYIKNTDCREADLYYDIGLIGLEFENYEYAITFFSKIINDPIHKIGAINNLAVAYSTTNQVDKATKLLKDQLDKDPYDYTSWICLGNVLAKNNEFDEALNALDIALAIDDTNIGCMKTIAKIYKCKGNSEKALQILKDAEKLDGNDYEIYIIMAECHMMDNKYKKAIRLFKKVADEFPDRAEIFHSLAVAYMLDNQPEKCYRNALKAWELEPDNLTYKLLVAKNLDDKNMFRQAETLYKEILETTKDLNLKLIVAQFYLRNDNPNKALKIAKEVENINSNITHIHLLKSHCYTVLGNIDAAEEEFNLETDEEAKNNFLNLLNNAKNS